MEHLPQHAIVEPMAGADESVIYRELMRFRPAELSPNAWAVKAGVSRTVWADMRRHGNPSRRTLEKLLVAAGSSLAEFEALRIGPDSQVAPHTRAVGDRSRGWSPAQLPPLPLLASAFGGEYSERGRGIWPNKTAASATHALPIWPVSRRISRR